MKSSIRWLSALLLGSSFVGSIDAVGDDDSLTISRRPELEYFKAVNRAGPPRDPQLLFLLRASTPMQIGIGKESNFSLRC